MMTQREHISQWDNKINSLCVLTLRLSDRALQNSSQPEQRAHGIVRTFVTAVVINHWS
jgi:hypothetical protein